MRKYFLVLGIVVFVFWGCQRVVNFKTEKFQNLYQVELPAFMNPINGLNKDASMQFASLDYGITFLVVHDKIEDIDKMFDNYYVNDSLKKGFYLYCDLVMLNMEESADRFEIIEKKDTLINDLKARKFDCLAKYQSDNAFIKLVLYQAKEYYFQAFAMSDSASMNKNKDFMRKMVESLEEL